MISSFNFFLISLVSVPIPFRSLCFSLSLFGPLCLALSLSFPLSLSLSVFVSLSLCVSLSLSLFLSFSLSLSLFLAVSVYLYLSLSLCFVCLCLVVSSRSLRSAHTRPEITSRGFKMALRSTNISVVLRVDISRRDIRQRRGQRARVCSIASWYEISLQIQSDQIFACLRLRLEVEVFQSKFFLEFVQMWRRDRMLWRDKRQRRGQRARMLYFFMIRNFCRSYKLDIAWCGSNVKFCWGMSLEFQNDFVGMWLCESMPRRDTAALWSKRAHAVFLFSGSSLSRDCSRKKKEERRKKKYETYICRT